MLNDLSVMIMAAPGSGGPAGSEFGKASPVGLFVIVALLVVALYIGYALTRRMRRLNRRRAFAEAHGIDVFDEEAMSTAMTEAGIADVDKKRIF